MRARTFVTLVLLVGLTDTAAFAQDPSPKFTDDDPEGRTRRDPGELTGTMTLVK